jgi:hypothetical protein
MTRRAASTAAASALVLSSVLVSPALAAVPQIPDLSGGPALAIDTTADIAYVGQSNPSVVIVDATTQAIVGDIPLVPTIGSPNAAGQIVADEDRGIAYAMDVNHRLFVLDPDALTATDVTPPFGPSNGTRHMALAGDTLFVADSTRAGPGATPHGQIYRIDVTTFTIEDYVILEGGFGRVVMDPARDRLLVGRLGFFPAVLAYDPTTLDFIDEVTPAGSLLAFDTATDRLYVAPDLTASAVSIIDAGDGSLIDVMDPPPAPPATAAFKVSEVAVEPTYGLAWVIWQSPDPFGTDVVQLWAGEDLVATIAAGRDLSSRIGPGTQQPMSLDFDDTGGAWLPSPAVGVLYIEPILADGATAAGTSVTTDGEADGASPSDPIETSVVSPNSGPLSISEGGITTGGPASYTFFGMQVDITAPAATVANPLVFTFVLDPVLVPSELPIADIEMFRNGALVADCSGPGGHAVPSPCVASRTELAGGDIEFVVHTAQASSWNFGLAGPDGEPPVITITTPADGAEYELGASVAADYGCEDAGSGLASCAGPVINGATIDTTTVGSYSFVVNAADNADNTSSASATYAVVWPFAFTSPVDALPTLNKVKAGASVPIKFTLGGDRGLDLFAAPVGVNTISCGSGADVDAVEEISAPGASGLSYDAATQTYTYVWRTNKAWQGSCRQLVLTMADGSKHRADFDFRK